MTRVRRAAAAPVTVVVAVVVAVALPFAACSRGTDPGTATVQVRQAPQRTAEAGSSRVALALGVGGATVSGEGMLDLKNGRGSLTLDLGALGTVDGVLDDGSLYVKVPALPTRKWVKLDLAAIVPQTGSGLGPLGRVASADPARALALLAATADDMHRVGSEMVRDAATTHSRGSIDPAKVLAGLPGLGSGPIADAVSAALGTAPLPLDVWVDDEGRMRKMAVQADPDGTGPVPPSSLELELYDFGVKVDVKPPPPDQVTDMTNAVKMFAGLFGN